MDIYALKNWFLNEKRDLPWRHSPSPYEVWISEVMLQQTQVAVVVDYYNRWMERFPTIQALARATCDEVMKLWEGLGYYSRVRNLHQAAKQLIEDGKNDLPDSPQELAKIKGLGPYTIGAILSFAFHQKAAAVDGNVIRLLSRYFLIEEPVDIGPGKKKIQDLTYHLLPDEEPWIVMEAFIELGAKICSVKPRCQSCPLQEGCLAYRDGKALQLPIKSKKTEVEQLKRYVTVIFHQDCVLLYREQSGRVMAGLHQFPYFENRENLEEQIFQRFKLRVSLSQKLQQVQHSFTRFRATLFPTVWFSSEKPFIEGFEWISLKDLSKLAFSSGHRRILKENHAYFAH